MTAPCTLFCFETLLLWNTQKIVSLYLNCFPNVFGLSSLPAVHNLVFCTHSGHPKRLQPLCVPPSSTLKAMASIRRSAVNNHLHFMARSLKEYGVLLDVSHYGKTEWTSLPWILFVEHQVEASHLVSLEFLLCYTCGQPELKMRGFPVLLPSFPVSALEFLCKQARTECLDSRLISAFTFFFWLLYVHVCGKNTQMCVQRCWRQLISMRFFFCYISAISPKPEGKTTKKMWHLRSGRDLLEAR